MVRPTAFKTIPIGVWSTAVRFSVWEKLSSTPVQHGHVGIYRQGTGCGSVGNCEGNIRGPARGELLFKTIQGEQAPPGGWWRVRDQVRYGEWRGIGRGVGVLVELIQQASCWNWLLQGRAWMGSGDWLILGHAKPLVKGGWGKQWRPGGQL